MQNIGKYGFVLIGMQANNQQRTYPGCEIRNIKER